MMQHNSYLYIIMILKLDVVTYRRSFDSSNSQGADVVPSCSLSLSLPLSLRLYNTLLFPPLLKPFTLVQHLCFICVNL